MEKRRKKGRKKGKEEGRENSGPVKLVQNGFKFQADLAYVS